MHALVLLTAILFVAGIMCLAGAAPAVFAGAACFSVIAFLIRLLRGPQPEPVPVPVRVSPRRYRR